MPVGLAVASAPSRFAAGRTRLRAGVRARPRLYALVRLLKYGPYLGLRRQGARRRLLECGRRDGWRMLNLGCGGRRIRGAWNLDVVPFTGPDLVGDGYRLPFREGAFDAIFCDYVIEHVRDPESFLRAASRSLAPGGAFYLQVPFLQPLHGEGHDYLRWTEAGFAGAAARAGLRVCESGVHMGPAFALHWVAREFGAALLCLGSRRVFAVLRYLLSWLLAPLLLLDLPLMRLPQAEILASGFYFVLRTDREPS